MQAGDVDRTAVINRVKRAQGQLAGVLRMIEDGRDLESVVHQLKAVSSAVDRAGFAIVAAELKAAAAADGSVSDEQLADVEKLFMSLS